VGREIKTGTYHEDNLGALNDNGMLSYERIIVEAQRNRQTPVQRPAQRPIWHLHHTSAASIVPQSRYMHLYLTLGWLCGVVFRMSDLRLAVVGSNPGHGTAGFSEVGDRFFQVNYLGM